jgi:hypothetical protein
MMSRGGRQYKYLIIVEGTTDVETYKELLVFYDVKEDDFKIISAGGCGNVCDANKWNDINVDKHIKLSELIEQVIGRVDFEKIILIVDSDVNTKNEFEYVKSNKKIENPKLENGYWLLDRYDGTKGIPVYGVKVPYLEKGCLESDLLKAYGCPIEKDYDNLKTIIIKASEKWNIPKDNNGKCWWEINSKARMDKYIYSALSHGFKISNPKRYSESVWKIPEPKEEPEVIKTLKKIFSL